MTASKAAREEYDKNSEFIDTFKQIIMLDNVSANKLDEILSDIWTLAFICGAQHGVNIASCVVKRVANKIQPDMQVVHDMHLPDGE